MNYVVCLKYGNKYSAEYVNKLYSMVKRNLTVPYEFVCFTEDSTNVNELITIKPLPPLANVKGWWYKPLFFNPQIGLEGTVLFLDLDMIIFRNIDNLFTYKPNEFCIIRDFNRINTKGYDKFNSSVFRFEKGSHNYVWDNLVKDLSQTKRMHGDQDWIFSQIKTGFVFWPTEWIQSYKWEVRDRTDLIKVGNQRRFKERASPVINGSTNILVFHGDPKPSEVEDLIVVQNWI